MTDTRVSLFGKELSSPVIPASGTFGFGYEFSDYYDINIIPAISIKGTTLEARYGNPLPRIADCPSGMLNAIGLQNPGVHSVVENEFVKLRKVYKNLIIANVGGSTVEDYVETASMFNSSEEVFAIELNISCPNVKCGGMAFGVSESLAKSLTEEVKRKAPNKPLIIKLSPNVTDISAMARAVEEGGADGISLINTLVGMRLDLRTGKPIISVGRGGYSGPGVFPVALRMVYEVSRAVKIPVIGMGGIMDGENVIEMMHAGANAVMVGTANLISPYATKNIIESLPVAMAKCGIEKLSALKNK